MKFICLMALSLFSAILSISNQSHAEDVFIDYDKLIKDDQYSACISLRGRYDCTIEFTNIKSKPTDYRAILNDPEFKACKEINNVSWQPGGYSYGNISCNEEFLNEGATAYYSQILKDPNFKSCLKIEINSACIARFKERYERINIRPLLAKNTAKLAKIETDLAKLREEIDLYKYAREVFDSQSVKDMERRDAEAQLQGKDASSKK